MKIAIDFIGGKLTASQKSHKAGWAHLRACQLSDKLKTQVKVLHDGESWDNFDTVYLYHGMEFQGSLNLFGGATEASAKFYERLVTPKPKLISLDIPMPNYGELCKGRLKSCDEYWKNVNWDAVSEKCKTIEYLQHPVITDNLVIGDSHSFSVYQSGYMTARKDGRTLRGVLKKTIEKEIEDFNINPESLNNITTYYGNIDVRHHLMRTTNPKSEIDLLLYEYESQLKSIGCKVELVHLLPIEHESRRLPKTGYFEGTPFFGLLEDRQKLVKYFNESLSRIADRNQWKIFTWPSDWYIMSPLDYFSKMEVPKSVHLSPANHRWNYWDNAINTPNTETESKLSDFF